jgi:hypothetical protein
VGVRVPSCCGREHRSAYCPSCGARLAVPSSLDGLLAHCRSQVRMLEREVASWDGSPPTTTRGLAMLARDRARLAKWRSWADGLAALLAPPVEGED